MRHTNQERKQLAQFMVRIGKENANRMSDKQQRNLQIAADREERKSRPRAMKPLFLIG